jgi:perosamine synthetase
MRSIPLFWPAIYKEEWLKALDKVFSTRWIGQGPLVDQFEALFAQKFKFKYCLSVNSGSAALELAYHLIGIKEGDEVLTAVLTCTATNIPLLRKKARLKFLDITDDLTVDYEDLKKKISQKTKAIVVVNLGGIQVDKRIFKLAKKHGIPVVIDAAQSLGITENNGDYVCYSFQAIKHFTTGDGGMLVLRNKKDYLRAKKLRWFGIDREAKRKKGWMAMVNHKTAMEIEEPGFKHHMNDIAAALGIVGLKYSDEILKHRQAICKSYDKKLPKDHKRVYGGSCWQFGILAKDRNKLIQYLRKNGIECDLVHLRNDIFKVFGGQRQDLPNMNRLENEYFYLPLNNSTTLEDVDFVAKIFNLWQK